MKIQNLDIDSIIPYHSNPRKNQPIDKVAKSIKEYGFQQPIVVDKDMIVIVGHTRLQAAKKLNKKEVPVLIADLDAKKTKAYRIADNRTNQDAEWDIGLLEGEIKDLFKSDYNLDNLGFSANEIENFLHEPTQGLTDEDYVPELPEEPISKLGDVWLLGRHKVVCGDSTQIDTADKLTNKQLVDVVFTDPPYGMSYGGGRAAGSTPKGARVKAHGMIKGDDLEGDSLIGLVKDALTVSVASAKKGAAFYVCFTWRTYSEFEDALEECGLSVSNCIVWDKKSIGLGNANYRPQHEFIFYVKGGDWHGDKSQSDIWQMGRGATTDYVHPTQKPVELIEKALLNSSKAGDIVLDVFGGSGSTLIAAEKTGRNAHIIELDEKYVDVIVKRWQEFTGKDATNEGTGKTFMEMSNFRGI